MMCDQNGCEIVFTFYTCSTTMCLENYRFSSLGGKTISKIYLMLLPTPFRSNYNGEYIFMMHLMTS